MAMTYPIFADGRHCGTLTVEREGLLRRFEGECMDMGRVLRLSVYGAGREGYLGVMEPADGRMRLCRRLTRHDTEMFPAVIEYAAEAGRGHTPPNPAPTGKSAAGDTLWYRVGDGSLFAEENGQMLRAYPCVGICRARFPDTREIGGILYAVFPVKHKTEN